MGDPVQDRRFKSDRVFNEINKLFITLKDDEMKEYNAHLQMVLETFIEQMKRTDPLFNACYRRIAYVGSYYEGLKVGKPEEFDLNVIINLPIPYSSSEIIIAPEKPGYIKIKTSKDVPINLRKHVRWPEYRVMDSWFDKNDYLDQNKFRSWFESVITRALSSSEYVNGKHELIASNGKKYRLHHKKSGPALTLKIDVAGGHTVDVDLVPALEFLTPPPKPFRNNITKEQIWFAISKPLDGPNDNIMWRPSFYKREGELLKGSIKQVIRQMKKLRDTQNFKSIASYYIKTMFLRELENQGYKPEFQKLNTTNLFFYMLKKFYEACEKGEIIDFWNPRNNLLGNISSAEMANIKFRLNKIIKEIEKRISSDPYVLAEFILTKEEYKQLTGVMQLTNVMAESSIQDRYEPAAEPVAEAVRGGFFSGMWNAFWGITGAPAAQ